MKIKTLRACLAAAYVFLCLCNNNPTNAPVPPTVAFSSARQTVYKNSGSARVDVVLSAIGKSDVMIPFTVMSGSTANNPFDYTLASSLSPLVIPAGESMGSINMSIKDNDAYQRSKTVILLLGTPINATLGAQFIDTVTILDTTTIPTVAFSSVKQVVSENAGTVNIQVALSTTSKYSVTLPVIVSDNPLVYTPDSTALVIPAGSLTGSVSLSLVDSIINVDSKTVILLLGTPINATLATGIVDTTVIVNASGFGQLYKLSDNELPGWVQDTSSNAFSVWKGEDMFNKIDGGATLYLTRGCLMSMFQNEVGPNGPDSQICLVMAMDFGSDSLADSMFEFQKLQASVPIPEYDTSVAIGYATLGGLTAYAHFKSMYFELQQGGYADQDSASLAAERFFKALESKTN